MDNKVTILEPNKTEALTYTIFRDSEKNLYLAVYREDLAQKDLKGLCASSSRKKCVRE